MTPLCSFRLDSGIIILPWPRHARNCQKPLYTAIRWGYIATGLILAISLSPIKSAPIIAPITAANLNLVNFSPKSNGPSTAIREWVDHRDTAVFSVYNSYTIEPVTHRIKAKRSECNDCDVTKRKTAKHFPTNVFCKQKAWQNGRCSKPKIELLKEREMLC